MEYQPKKCRKARKKGNVNIFDEILHDCSQSSLSSESDLLLCPFKIVSKCSKKRKEISQSHHRHDYLTRLFEKKKLKDKSLSKKMKTPFDRKLNRTCWPIELGKVSKIKKKPREKRKGKPTQRSLKRKKFSNPSLFSPKGKTLRRKTPSISSSGSEVFDDDSFGEVNRPFTSYRAKHFLYEPVTPQMLIDILQDPEHLKSGATIDMIIAKLRALKLDLNPSQELLKEEVLRKLSCAIKLGLVKEDNGYYKIGDSVQMNRMPRKKIVALWEAWYRKPVKRKGSTCLASRDCKKRKCAFPSSLGLWPLWLKKHRN